MTAPRASWDGKVTKTPHSQLERDEVYLLAGCDTLTYQTGRKLRSPFESLLRNE